MSARAEGSVSGAGAQQRRAADPAASAFVSANAGSGKTRVLTERVARLLFRGTPPERILCLTFTKAAAAEMQNRLFDTLGKWAMLEDDKLLAALARIGIEATDARVDLDKARTLFAQAVETPGGLKIQTIHAFCGALLRRFPIEAQVPPGFSEMDERAGARLREEILARMAEGPHRDVIDALAAHHSGARIADFAAKVAGLPVIPSRAALAAHLDVPGTLCSADVHAVAWDGSEGGLLREVVPILLACPPEGNDFALGTKLARVRTHVSCLPDWEDACLFGEKAKTPFAAKTPANTNRPNVTAKIRKGAFPCEAFDAMQERIEVARPLRQALAALERTEALRGFAEAFGPLYRAAKLRRGWLDFDDLVLRAAALLKDRSVAQWVLWRLDGGIDHILVDEAQDTSPVQWTLIEKLTDEMTAGMGAEREEDRSVFVVGDPKQSIYGFQGAEPGGFERMEGVFRARMEGARKPFRSVPLRHSFRSAPAVLRAVDAVFAGVPDLGGADHRAFFEDIPGRVDLWPVIADDPEAAKARRAAEAEAPYDLPVDRLADDHHDVQLARKVVDEVLALVRAETPIPHLAEGGAVEMRPLTPSDVLILFRSRNAMFHETIRYAKQQGLEVAGADRLRVGAELAVKDVTSLMAWLALPEDDLALAEALRSPLFGWDEAALFDAAHGRKGRLWNVIRERGPVSWPYELSVLTDLRARADFDRPYELIDRVLTRHGGRARLIARLGPEAGEGIDALLDLALDYERAEVPSLTGFVSWLRSDASEIKRAADAASGVRAMTVHGAKGLEAPVVILPQTRVGARQPPTDPLLTLELIHPAANAPVPHAVWAPNKADCPAPLLAAQDAARAAEAAEELRLLYVAMTRARAWLIVAGSGEMGKERAAWHPRVEAALKGCGAAELETPAGPGLRLENGDWSRPAHAAAALRADALVPPAWVRAPVPQPHEPPKPRAPSDLGGAKTLPGEDGGGEEARLRGIHLHRLLEHLPRYPDDPDLGVAGDLLLTHVPPAREADLPGLVRDARACIDAHPALFGEGTLAEVDVAGEIAGLGPVEGAIDRLVPGKRILAVDYKSNARVPERPEDIPEGLLRQMGAYGALLDAIWPGHEVALAILWTRRARLMEVPRPLARAALARAGAVHPRAVDRGVPAQ